MKPTHFDMTVTDLAQAKKFFAEALGWQFERFAAPYEYYYIQAGSSDEAGINGGIGALADAPAAQGLPMTLVTVPVADLEQTLAKVTAAGG